MKNGELRMENGLTDWTVFKRMFGFIRPYWPGYVVGMLIYNSQGFVFPLMNTIFFGGAVTAMLAGELSGVINAGVLMFAMLIGFAVFMGLGILSLAVSELKGVRDLKRTLFRAFVKNNLEAATGTHSGEGIAAINTDSETARNLYDDNLSPFLRNVIAVSLSAVAVMFIDWRMGLGAILVGGLAFLIQSRFGKPLAQIGKERLETNAEAVKSLSNLLTGALAIRALGRQRRAIIEFDRENGKLKKLAFREAFISMWRNLFTTVQGWMTMALTFGFGGWLAVTGDGSFGLAQMMMVMPLAEAIGGSMSAVGAAYAGLQPSLVASRRVLAIIDSVPGAELGKDAQIPAPQGDYTIRMRDLSFRYADAEGDALAAISLEIPQNKMVAFLGESGSGKSTLLRVIMGMYERDSLAISVGNKGYDRAALAEWRSRFAYVDQTCKLFDMTIGENIAMGAGGVYDEAEIIAAAKAAHAHEFIEALPDGYATEVGEKGSSLSGGQKQRIAIARALYRRAPILVFDEATSSLDAESERAIMATINELRRDHTILITTHNPENVANADVTVRMEKGRII
jgi:ABC-type multidrug transport system fused ATPase/permease subunit